LLAILQAPHNEPAKSRQAIVSRAYAWQGIPQPGTPKPNLALRESPATPGTPGCPPTSSSTTPDRQSHTRAQTDSPLRRPRASPAASPCASPLPRAPRQDFSPGPPLSGKLLLTQAAMAASPRTGSPLRPSAFNPQRRLWPDASPTPRSAAMSFSPWPASSPSQGTDRISGFGDLM
jgi:hypothetical protein